MEASARSLHDAARRSPSGTYRRPPTSCAHRLRKPDHARELLTPSVAPRTRDRGLLPRALTHPAGWPFSSGRLPRGTPRHPGFRRARLAVTAAGLERRTIDEPERLPSDRPEPRGSGRLGHACCSREWPRPAPCRLPRSRPAPSRAGGPLQAILPLLAHTPVTRGLSRKLRKRCVSPTSATDFTSRAPRGLLDSRLRVLHVTPRGALTHRCATYRTRRLALGHGPGGDEVGCPDAACQTSQPGGASLDGEPPASASAATRYLDPLGASGVGAPDGFLDQVHQTQRSPGGAAIDSPSAPNLPVRAFSAANRACDEASDVLFHDPGWTHLDRRP